MKKTIFVIITLIVIGAYFIVLYVPKNYKTNYTINKYKIDEEYLKDKKVVNFKIIKNNLFFAFSLDKKNSIKRQIIKDIRVYKEGKINCIYPIINKEKTYPICNIDNKMVHFSLIKNKTFLLFLNNNYKMKSKEVNVEYNKIKISNYDDSIFIIWNYNNLLYLKNGENKKMSLFKSEIINTDLIVKINKYLLIPNYDQKYSFTSFYIVDLNTFEKHLWKTEFEFSYNSYIMGIYNNKIYLLDRKNKYQYEINPTKKTIIKINKKDQKPKIYINGWDNISVNKLIKKDYLFEDKRAFSYQYKNQKLSLLTYNNNPMLLINDVDINVISYEKNKLYYLINDELYVFDVYFGSKKLLKNFEWNFNYNNKIFVYNK